MNGIKLMFKKTWVMLCWKFLPKKIFVHMRRRYAFCDFNFHSAIRVRPDKNISGKLGTFRICKHCGVSIELLENGRWRALGNSPFNSRHSEERQDMEKSDAYMTFPLAAQETTPDLILPAVADGLKVCETTADANSLEKG